MVIDGQGAVTTTIRMNAFGETRHQGEAIANRFPGQVYDAETGLHYNWFRSYGPKAGRYTQEDPAGLADGVGVFNYLGSNPITFGDPTGEVRVVIFLCRPFGIFRPNPGPAPRPRLTKRQDCDFYEIRDCVGKIVYVGITQQNPGAGRCNQSHPQIRNLQPDCPRCRLSCTIVRRLASKASCLRHETQMILRLRPFMNARENPDSNEQRSEKRRQWQNLHCPKLACERAMTDGVS